MSSVDFKGILATLWIKQGWEFFLEAEQTYLNVMYQKNQTRVKKDRKS